MKKAILLSVLLVAMPLQATTLKEKREALDTTKETIEQKQTEMEQNQTKQEEIMQRMKEIDTEMVDIGDNIKVLQEQISEKEQQLSVKEIELSKAMQKKDEQYEATKARLTQMYKNQKVSYLQILFSSTDFWDAINKAEYVRRISKKDNQILETYQEQVEIIDAKRQKVEAEKSELDALYDIEVTKNESMEAIRNEKLAFIEALSEQEDEIKQEISNLEEAANQLAAEIDELTRELIAKGIDVPMYYTGGQFLWPVPGYTRISSDYISRTSPISGKAEFHTGIDIPAAYGEDVLAAADGIVITSGWVNGFGNTIMINHGGGLVTLYGHNSSVVVPVGTSVKKGDVVAKIGSTGYSTGNHCHFEVRVNGSHTSPWPYLKG